jgi:putative FmdB family regulatory protein
MPTYVYRCQNCDTLTEAFQKITEDPLTTCDDCGGSIRRVLQPVGIVFKGSGFYVTDYKRTDGSSNGKSAEAGSTKSETGTGKSEGGETKPAAEKAAKKETAQPVAAAS